MKTFFERYDVPIGGFLLAYTIGLVIGLPIYLYYNTPGWGIISMTFVTYVLGGMATGVYHRHYAHKAYDLNIVIELLALFFSTLNMGGSALRWSHDHRIHHRFVDTDRDPYGINRGFWYAHMGWLFLKKQPIDYSVIEDLVEKPHLRFQHKYFGLLTFGLNILYTLLIGWLCGDLLGAFVLVWWLRVFICHHVTWFVNSAAHTWGTQTYSREISAFDNFLVAVITFGEGYHNYHHVFERDYRNGIKWWHIDPNKWAIFLLSRVGLASNLVRNRNVSIYTRLINEDRRLAFEKLRLHAAAKRDHFEERISSLYSALKANLATMAVLMEKRKKAAGKLRRKVLKRKLRTEIRLFRQRRRDWNRLVETVVRVRAA